MRISDWSSDVCSSDLAAADLRTAFEVDRAEHPAQLDVVTGLEALRGEVTRGADGLQDHEVVLATPGGVVRGEVRDAAQRGLPLDLGLPLGGLGRLDVGREYLGAGQPVRLLLGISERRRVGAAGVPTGRSPWAS